MARLESLPAIEIIQGFKGTLDFAVWKGVPYARAWPRFRPANQTQATRAAAAIFGAILSSYSQLSATVRAFFVDDAKDQPRTPRDLYMAATLGTLHERTPPPVPPNTFTTWMPDAPPITPSAYDDEFDDADFDLGLWTEFDPAADLTVSETETGLILDAITDPGDDVCGIYQPIPAGDFTIVAKLALTALRANYAGLGLCLWDDATDPAASIYSWQNTYRAADFSLDIIRWTNYTTYGAGIWGQDNTIINTHIYCRIRRIGTTYKFDWSSDGLGWQQVHSGSLTFTPDHFGIMINNVGTGITIRGIATFFRYIDDGTFTLILQGDRIRVTRFN